jgi:hypothetical protein
MIRTTIVFVAIITFITFNSASAQTVGVMSKAVRMTGDSFRYSARTGRGASVVAVNRPSPAVMNAIDRGLAELFDISRRNGYRNRLNYSDYTIYIAKADRDRDSQGQYSPDIAIGAAQYKGSIYDQGGYIFAAGLVLSAESSAFVIAEHTRDLDRVANVVRYEGEHIVLYHNDRRRFAATLDHSRGGGHPIMQ